MAAHRSNIARDQYPAIGENSSGRPKVDGRLTQLHPASDVWIEIGIRLKSNVHQRLPSAAFAAPLTVELLVDLAVTSASRDWTALSKSHLCLRILQRVVEFSRI